MSLLIIPFPILTAQWASAHVGQTLAKSLAFLLGLVKTVRVEFWASESAAEDVHTASVHSSPWEGAPRCPFRREHNAAGLQDPPQ